MQFDYILTNPPFVINKNKTAYRTIIEKMMRLSGDVSFIGPTGALNKNMYRVIKKNLTYAERLGFKEFPVGVACVRGHWVVPELPKNPKNPKTNKDSGEIVFKINGQIWEPGLYPLRVPFVCLSQQEYHNVFDQNGQHWKVFSQGDPGAPGIYRDKQDPNGPYIYDSDVSIKSVTSCTNAKYMPVTNPAKGKRLAKTLSEMEKQKKIHGYWGRGFRHATIDLDPIRRDLL